MAECPHFLAKQQLPFHSKQVISQVLNYAYLKLTTVKVATAILAMPLLSQELVFLATSHFYIMSQFSVYIAAPEHGNGSLPFLVLGGLLLFYFLSLFLTNHLPCASTQFFFSPTHLLVVAFLHVMSFSLWVLASLEILTHPLRSFLPC